MKFRLAYRLIWAFAFTVLILSVVACGTPPVLPPTPAPSPSVTLPSASTATASPPASLTAPIIQATPSVAQPTLTQVVTASAADKTATPKPTKTIEQIVQGWSNTRYLDYAHLSRGMTCQTCHQTATPNAHPSMQTCIDCHPDTVPAIGAKRRGSTPHNAHLGFLNCFQCHHGHEPFQLFCNRCHTIIQTSRFQ